MHISLPVLQVACAAMAGYLLGCQRPGAAVALLMGLALVICTEDSPPPSPPMLCKVIRASRPLPAPSAAITPTPAVLPAPALSRAPAPEVVTASPAYMGLNSKLLAARLAKTPAQALAPRRPMTVQFDGPSLRSNRSSAVAQDADRKTNFYHDLYASGSAIADRQPPGLQTLRAIA